MINANAPPSIECVLARPIITLLYSVVALLRNDPLNRQTTLAPLTDLLPVLIDMSNVVATGANYWCGRLGHHGRIMHWLYFASADCSAHCMPQIVGSVRCV